MADLSLLWKEILGKVELEQYKRLSWEVTTGEGVMLKPLVNVVTQLKIVSTITVNSRSPLA